MFWRKERREWIVEVLDDLGRWGSVDWADLRGKAKAASNLFIHPFSSVFREDHFYLDDATRIVALLASKDVFRQVYRNRHIRIYNKRTGEAIPLESLGVEPESIDKFSNSGEYT